MIRRALLVFAMFALALAAACSSGVGPDDTGDLLETRTDPVEAADPPAEGPSDAADHGDAGMEEAGELPDDGVADAAEAADAPDEAELPPPPVKGFKTYDLTAVGSVRSMWASQDQSIWAVGDAGLVLRFDGVDFVPVAPPPTTRDLTGVAGAGGTVVAVGLGGTAVAFRDGAWTDLEPPTTADLYAVGVVAPDDVYVAGKGATILHWNGGEWTSMGAGISYDLFGIWASAAGGVFVVGSSGSVLELKGSQFVHSQVAGPTTRLRSIWRSPDGHMFAVGSGGTVAHHDGVVWRLQVTNDASDPPRDLYQVFGFGSDEVYAVGDGGVVLRYDGDKWGVQTVAGPFNTFADLRGVAGVLLPDGTRRLFAAGLGARALEAYGKTWVDRRLGVTRALRGVTVRPDGEVLAVGAAGLVLTFSEGRFGTIASGTSADLSSASGAYIAGARATLLRREAAGLVAIAAATDQDLSDVWEVGSGAWVVGTGGAVLGVVGDEAKPAGGVGGAKLNAVCTTAGGAVVVAGAGGRLWWNQGDGLAEVSTGTTSELWDLAPASDDSVFAVGDNGVVLRCDAGGCQRVHEEPATFLYGVGGRADLLLAVGWAGTVLRLDAAGVEPLSTGTFRVFRSVAAGDEGPAAMVGDDGTFAVYAP